MARREKALASDPATVAVPQGRVPIVNVVDLDHNASYKQAKENVKELKDEDLAKCIESLKVEFLTGVDAPTDAELIALNQRRAVLYASLRTMEDEAQRRLQVKAWTAEEWAEKRAAELRTALKLDPIAAKEAPSSQAKEKATLLPMTVDVDGKKICVVDGQDRLAMTWGMVPFEDCDELIRKIDPTSAESIRTGVAALVRDISESSMVYEQRHRIDCVQLTGDLTRRGGVTSASCTIV